jgi:hypothetical protein
VEVFEKVDLNIKLYPVEVENGVGQVEKRRQI